MRGFLYNPCLTRALTLLLATTDGTANDTISIHVDYDKTYAILSHSKSWVLYDLHWVNSRSVEIPLSSI